MNDVMSIAGQSIGRHLLRGLVVVDRLGVGQTGHNKAMCLVQPQLSLRGIELVFVGVRSGTQLARSLADCWYRERVSKFDFVLFNALASLSTPWGLRVARLAILTRSSAFMYWREMPAAFQKLAASKPEVLRTVDRLFSRPTGLIHLANSVACSRAIQARYPATKPITVYNCAEVPQPFDRLTVPSSDPPQVLAIGTIQPLKGTDLFVQTAIKVCREHPNVEFCWLGEGADFGSWRKNIETAGLTHRIVFPGYVQAPHLLLRRASVVFVPSRQESFSQVTAEAMCLGRKVVTFESGGPPEVLGGHGVVVPDFDTDAAADTILRLLRGPQDALTDAKARERYLQLFTPEVHANRLDRTIRGCLSGNSCREYPTMGARCSAYGAGDDMDGN